MKSRRIMAKSLVFALALGMFSYVGSETNTAKAAGITAAFDSASGTAKMTVAGDEKYVWGVAKKMKKAPKKGKVKFTQKDLAGTWYEVKSFDDVYGGLIDVNAVAKGKETNILVVNAAKVANEKLETDDYKLLEIKASDKNFKVVYSADGKGIDAATDNKVAGDAESGYLAFFKSDGIGKKAEQFLPTGEDVQMKKGKNGAWKDLKTYFEGGAFDDDKADKRVNVLTQNGAELSFRLKGSATQFMSKEVKVKVTKRAKAPKVKVDVNKDMVNLKKGMQYTVKLDADNLQAATEVKDGKGLSFKDMKIKSEIENEGDGKKQQVLEVKNLAKGKKLASRVATILLNRQAAPVIGKDAKTSKELKTQGGTVVQDKADDASAKPLVTLKLDTTYDPSKGAILENLDTTTDYEFGIGYKEGSTAPKKWISLRRAKDDKTTKVKIKASATEKDGTYNVDHNKPSVFFIRKAGDSKSNPTAVTLASAPLDIKMKLEKIEQTLKSTTTGAAGAAVNDIAIAVDFKKNTEVSFSLHVTNLVKTDAKPKLNAVKTPVGVTIKASSFDGTNGTNGYTSTVTVSIKEKNLSTFNTGEVSFEFVVEGVKKTVKLNLTNTGA